MNSPAFDSLRDHDVHVTPLTSTRTGEPVRNQYSIEFLGCVAFQSYDTLIAVYDKSTERLTVGRRYDFSVTTSKYLGIWLRENVPGWAATARRLGGRSQSDTIRRAIDAGVISYDRCMV